MASVTDKSTGVLWGRTSYAVLRLPGYRNESGQILLGARYFNSTNGAMVSPEDGFVTNDGYLLSESQSALAVAEIAKRTRKSFEGTRISVARGAIGVCVEGDGEGLRCLESQPGFYTTVSFSVVFQDTRWDLCPYATALPSSSIRSCTMILRSLHTHSRDVTAIPYQRPRVENAYLWPCDDPMYHRYKVRELNCAGESLSDLVAQPMIQVTTNQGPPLCAPRWTQAVSWQYLLAPTKFRQNIRSDSSRFETSE